MLKNTAEKPLSYNSGGMEQIMSIQAVRDCLKQFGAEGRVLELAESSATVELAAHALGIEEARIAKTLSVRSGEELVLLVLAGDAKTYNGKIKCLFHQKPPYDQRSRGIEVHWARRGWRLPFFV